MMKHDLFKRLAAALLAAAAVLPFAGCAGGESTQQSSASESKADTPAVTGDVTVRIFNVGKADAMVIQTANTVTVIDAGNKGDGKYIDKYLAAQGIDTIDTMLITHFDKDHVGGAARIINRLHVKEVLVPDYVSTSDEYESFIEKAQETETPVTALNMGSKRDFTLDDAVCTVYAPEKNDYGKNEENDFSLVLYLRHGENTMLFTGDAEAARQQEIMNLNLGKVNFLKFPYHGNYMATTEKFLDACQPDCTVICCSEEEYADPSTVETLEKRNISTLYTCDGDVTVVSDGKVLTYTQDAAAE